jgi:hypothetical protein
MKRHFHRAVQTDLRLALKYFNREGADEAQQQVFHRGGSFEGPHRGEAPESSHRPAAAIASATTVPTVSCRLKCS